jgi:hypothetical protein
MTVVVTPEVFRFVQYDSLEIASVVDDLLARLGLAGTEVALEVDETTPLTRVVAHEGVPLRIEAGSGALEDTRVPRTFSATATQVNVGRVLLRRRDRGGAAFAGAPDDAGLSLAELAAWDVTCVGRLGRSGVRVHADRWRYNLRNRIGFTDATDAVFDRLWATDDPSWSDIAAASGVMTP